MRVKQNNEWINMSEEIQWKQNNEWHRHSSANYPSYYVFKPDEWAMVEMNMVEYWGFDQYVVIPEMDITGVFPTHQAIIPWGTMLYGIATGSAKLKTTEYMFYAYRFYGEHNTIELDYFFTPEVTTMEAMFEEADDIEYLDLRSFDTAKCSNFQGMFGFTISLKTLDISSFDISTTDLVEDMFIYSGVETVYVKNQQIADHLDMYGGKPGINFVIGSST